MRVKKVIAADVFDSEREQQARLAVVVVVILGVIVDVLRRDAVFGEKALLGGGEEGLGTTLAFSVGSHGLFVERLELLREGEVFHGGEKLTAKSKTRIEQATRSDNDDAS